MEHLKKLRTNFNHTFVTVGTTKFDSLIEKIISPEVINILVSKGCTKLTLQIGASILRNLPNSKQGLQISYFDYKPDLLGDIKSADLVISHCGAGTILDVLRCNKPLLVVINESLMDNHQAELADKLSESTYLYSCRLHNLSHAIANLDTSKLKEFPQPNPRLFCDFVDSIMQS